MMVELTSRMTMEKRGLKAIHRRQMIICRAVDGKT
jgi:hypothetical protein